MPVTVLSNFAFGVPSLHCFLTLTTPNLPKSSKGHLFRKISTVGNWYFFTSLNGAKLLPGKKYSLYKCWIWKINTNAWCILKIRGMFSKGGGEGLMIYFKLNKEPKSWNWFLFILWLWLIRPSKRKHQFLVPLLLLFSRPATPQFFLNNL